jgi:hypothetical protein
MTTTMPTVANPISNAMSYHSSVDAAAKKKPYHENEVDITSGLLVVIA